MGLKSNRQLDPNGCGNRAISELAFEQPSKRMHFKGFGWVTTYRVEQSQPEARFFISDEGQRLDEMKVQQKKKAQQIEGYHRGLKQECHIECC